MCIFYRGFGSQVQDSTLCSKYGIHEGVLPTEVNILLKHNYINNYMCQKYNCKTARGDPDLQYFGDFLVFSLTFPC